MIGTGAHIAINGFCGDFSRNLSLGHTSRCAHRITNRCVPYYQPRPHCILLKVISHNEAGESILNVWPGRPRHSIVWTNGNQPKWETLWLMTPGNRCNQLSVHHYDRTLVLLRAFVAVASLHVCHVPSRYIVIGTLKCIKMSRYQRPHTASFWIVNTYIKKNLISEFLFNMLNE